VSAVNPTDLVGLTHALSAIGLTRDDDFEKYGAFAHLQTAEDGLWQHPEELARALIATRATPAATGLVPCRFLEVGTWRGATFWLMRAYFVAHVNAEMVTMSLDSDRNTVYPEVEAQLLHPFLLRGDTADLAEAIARGRVGPFDMVFIDGDHSYEGVRADTARLRSAARVLMYHDVADRLIAAAPGNNGGVPAFWAELSAELGPRAVQTVIGSGKPQDRQGFGIAVLPPPPAPAPRCGRALEARVMPY